MQQTRRLVLVLMVGFGGQQSNSFFSERDRSGGLGGANSAEEAAESVAVRLPRWRRRRRRRILERTTIVASRGYLPTLLMLRMAAAEEAAARGKERFAWSKRQRPRRSGGRWE